MLRLKLSGVCRFAGVFVCVHVDGGVNKPLVAESSACGDHVWMLVQKNCEMLKKVRNAKKSENWKLEIEN
jgi:hypothetical protein